MVDGLSMSQFSFQIPRPLQENYVRKRSAAPHLTAAAHPSRPHESTEANPIAWAGPDETYSRLGSLYLEAHVFDPVGRTRAKKELHQGSTIVVIKISALIRDRRANDNLEN